METAPSQADALVAIQRAQFSRAARYDDLVLRCQVAVTICAAAALFVPDIGRGIVEWVLELATILLCVATLVFTHRSRALRDVGERARRASLLVQGLGIQLSRTTMLDTGRRASEPSGDLDSWQDPKYFATQAPVGATKAAEMLYESAFWSEDLFERSAEAIWGRVAVLGVVVLLCFAGAFLPPEWFGGGAMRVPFKIASTLVSSFVLAELILRALKFSRGAQAVHEVRERLDGLEQAGYPKDDLFVLLADYNAAVEGTPLMVNGVYDKNKKRLNALWDEYKSKKP